VAHTDAACAQAGECMQGPTNNSGFKQLLSEL